MTCIVAVKHEGSIVMGADSAGIAGWDLQIRADAKVFTRGPFLMGFTTSFRMGQLLQYRLSVPTREPRDEELHEFMATEFVDAVRSCLRDGGWSKKNSEQEEGGQFLVGFRGRIFRISSDFQVGESADDFDAVGSGESIALGALFVTRGHQSPHDRVVMALSAAERYSVGVRGPFIVKDLPALRKVA